MNGRRVLIAVAAVLVVGVPAIAQAQRPDDEAGTPAESNSTPSGVDEGGVATKSHGVTGDFDDFVSIRNPSGTGLSRLNLNATDSLVINSDAWRLANNAGSKQFEISEGGTTPRMVIDQGGNVGIGTEEPESPLTVNRTGGFQLRLQGSGADYRFDAFGTSLRMGPSSNSNAFRIFDDASFNNLTLRAGNAGIGTADPQAPLHVQRGDGTAAIKVDEQGGSGRQTLLDLSGKTSAFARFSRDATDSNQWLAGIAEDGEFTISTGDAAATKLALGSSGDLSLNGSIGQLGTADARTDVAAANGGELTNRLRSLPLSTWRFAGDPAGLVHIAPTAADFNATFGFGDAEYLGVADMASVALGVAKELDARLTAAETAPNALDARLTTAETAVKELGARLAAADTAVAAATQAAARANKRARRANKRARKALRRVRKLSKLVR